MSTSSLAFMAVSQYHSITVSQYQHALKSEDAEKGGISSEPIEIAAIGLHTNSQSSLGGYFITLGCYCMMCMVHLPHLSIPSISLRVSSYTTYNTTFKPHTYTSPITQVRVSKGQDHQSHIVLPLLPYNY